MKKSKIIVPALGILLLSTAASVSGTVAWFTAARTFNTHVGNFAVVNTKDNLECVQAAGVGTSYDSGTNVISVAANSKLTDGSFDHTASKIYAPNAEGDKVGKVIALGSAVDGASDASTANGLYRETLSDGTTKLYTAFTWTMTFSVTFGSSATDTALYIDLSQSKVTLNGTNAPTQTGKGFRLAFMPTTVPSGSSAVAKVWADNQTGITGSPANVRYIGSSAAVDDSLATKATDYVASAIITNETTAVPADSTANASATTSAINYLGTFKGTADTKVSITYTVVAWFEGTDPTIVTRATNAEYETVQADLYFGVSKIAA